LAILGVLVVGVARTWAQDYHCEPLTKRALLKDYAAVFIGTVVPSDDESPARLDARSPVRLDVTEQFAGELSRQATLYELPMTPHRDLEAGRQYLVFAQRCPEERDSRCLVSYPCAPTRDLEHAAGLLRQLRAERSGRPFAPVYGMLLYRELQDQDRPLGNVVVRLHNGMRSFETKTDEQGAYSFEQVESGTYRVSAELPAGMEITEDDLGEPAEPVDVSAESSLEHNIFAVPTARIAGTVIGPDNKPLHGAMVSLYRPGRVPSDPGLERDFVVPTGRIVGSMLGPHGEFLPGNVVGSHRPGGFDFDHLPAGDYILVFNYWDSANLGTPFHRTFYPRADTAEDAQAIRLSAGQQITNADIHVGETAAAREIKVRIAWSGKEPPGPVPVRVVAEGRGTWTTAYSPQTDDPHVYALALWGNVRYSVKATTRCHPTGWTDRAQTDVVSVDGGDTAVSEVTLTFDENACAIK
jgi:hypothetical protein